MTLKFICFILYKYSEIMVHAKPNHERGRKRRRERRRGRERRRKRRLERERGRKRGREHGSKRSRKRTGANQIGILLSQLRDLLGVEKMQPKETIERTLAEIIRLAFWENYEPSPGVLCPGLNGHQLSYQRLAYAASHVIQLPFDNVNKMFISEPPIVISVLKWAYSKLEVLQIVYSLSCIHELPELLVESARVLVDPGAVAAEPDAAEPAAPLVETVYDKYWEETGFDPQRDPISPEHMAQLVQYVDPCLGEP